jgi:hypothetical protein
MSIGWSAPVKSRSPFVQCKLSTVAVKTLSSPIGPMLSTLLIGAGAVLGAGRSPAVKDDQKNVDTAV